MAMVDSSDKWLRREKMRTYVLYHGNCFDGMASAWAMWKKLGDMDVTYHPVLYGAPIPEMEDASTVYIVDFAYKRNILDDLNDKHLLTVIDHHKSAQEELKGAPYGIFDLTKSGARLAWEFCFPDKIAPKLVRYVEDRDLWKFELPWSREVNAFIQSFPMTLEDYESAARSLQSNFSSSRSQGMAIERYKETMVEKMCEKAPIVTLNGYQVPIVNASILFSEVGHHLCELFPGAPFSVSYFDRTDGRRQYSLRSIGDFDVSVVARANGGGGHKNASGFETSKPDLGKIFVEKIDDETSKTVNS